MKLDAYLERIGHTAPLGVNLETLNALHAAHLHAIPFENLEVMLQRPLSQDAQAAYEKIVIRRRGGWCYEMNALFGWVLGQIGFDVQRVSAGVRRSARGDEMLGNHLCLMVRLDRDYLVDVGFGGRQVGAIPLSHETTGHPPFQMALADLGDGFWRLHEGGPNAAHSYDFQPFVCDEAALKERFEHQCTYPDSVFRKHLSVSRRGGRDLVRMRGLLMERMKPGRLERHVITSPDELLETLLLGFGLDEPDMVQLWPELVERHKALFPHW